MCILPPLGGMSYIWLLGPFENQKTHFWSTRVKKEFKRKIGKYLGSNTTKNTTYQNLRNAGKAVLRGKLMLINTYDNTEQKFHITLYLKEIEKEKWSKSFLAKGRK